MQATATLADPEIGGLDDIVDLTRYPLAAQGEDLADEVRASLERHGAVALPGFLRPEALQVIATGLASAAAHVSIRRHHSTVLARRDLEQGLDPTDPRCHSLEWLAGHVTRDMIPPYCPGHRLYVSPVFKRFIAACVGQSRIFEYADPLAGLVATVLPPDGGCYPWHYDTNEFVVTLMIQRPAGGGRFEYHHDLRRPGDENLGGLRRVLDGEGPAPSTCNANPGDLQLFRGRYSLHRVTPVEGPLARHVMVLSYADRAGVIGPLDRTRAVYGRVTEAHLLAAEASALGADGLIL